MEEPIQKIEYPEIFRICQELFKCAYLQGKNIKQKKEDRLSAQQAYLQIEKILCPTQN